MLRFLVLGDWHYSSKTPGSRIDNFKETRQKKTKEIMEIANKYKIDAFLEMGDFLNSDRLSEQELASLAKDFKFSQLNNKILQMKTGETTFREIEQELKNTIPVIGTIGNHELIGNEISSLEETSLNVLISCGAITIATKEKPVIFKDKEGFSLAITGAPYTHNIDGEDKSAYIVNKKLADFHIHLVHGYLMPKSYGKKFKHTVVSQIADTTKADLTINGHDHIGYDEININGKKFINPGSPFRLSAELKEINRMPKVILIEVDKNGINAKPIFISCAKKGSEVLSREKIVNKKKKLEKIEDVKSLMNKAELAKGIDIVDIVKNIAKNKNIDDNIRDKAVNNIVENIKLMKVPFSPKGKYTITELEIVNFACFKHAVFEFSEGLNVVSGVSGQGKSAVLRAIREVYDCYIKNPRNHILSGEDFFKITLYLSNGFVISRIVENNEDKNGNKRKGKNGYEIFDPNKGCVEYFNTKAITTVQEILGFNKVKLSEKSSVDVNFINQGDPWFFVGKNMSSTDKAKLVGSLYGTQYGDVVVKEMTSNIKKINMKKNVIEKEVSELEERKESYNYVFKLEENINKVESILNEIKLKKALIEKLSNFSLELIEKERSISELEKKMLKLTENKEKITDMFELLTNKFFKIKILEEKSAELTKVLKLGTELRGKVEALKEIDKAHLLISNLKDSYEKIELEEKKLYEYKKIESEKTNIYKKYKYLKDQYDVLLDIEKHINKIENLKRINETIKEKSQKLKEISILEDEFKNIRNRMDKFNLIRDKLNGIDDIEFKLINLKEQKEKIEIIEKQKEELSIILEQGKELRHSIEKKKEYLINKIEIYKKLLLEVETCPICHAKIDKIVVNSIINNLIQF
ncbi:metallophosphoesterase [Clostridioides sp. ZZV14-6045]|uniref:metallophosphoesterase n=1 Tax=Clostridioides sp. ZZV14-6045 TaxID=2811489 RepID=UPI001D1087B6|nr:metallophosphoesterase [Clostridioides sp. ZZV14-6045]